MTSHQMAVTEHQNWLRYHGEMIQHFVQVGQMSLQTPTNTSPSTSKPVIGTPPLSLQSICDTAERDLPSVLHWEGLQDWLHWLRGVEDVQAPIRWISWMELLVHFQQSTGIRGMRCHDRGHHRQWRRISMTEDITMRKISSCFAQFGWNVIRHFDPSWKTVQRRPSCHRLQAWLNCIPVRVNETVIHCVERWLEVHDVKVLRTRDLDSIPSAI